jgi:hypothetical protein
MFDRLGYRIRLWRLQNKRDKTCAHFKKLLAESCKKKESPDQRQDIFA